MHFCQTTRPITKFGTLTISDARPGMVPVRGVRYKTGVIPMNRRDFLKNTLSVAFLAPVSSLAAKASEVIKGGQDIRMSPEKDRREKLRKRDRSRGKYSPTDLL